MPIIPATLEIVIRRITVAGQPGKKVIKTFISANKLVVMSCICDVSYSGGISRRM
jgi:hypothetical protein